MTQADSNYSTRAPVDPTRRGFMSQAASVAAGGAVLAVGVTIPAPAQALPDPILAAIEAHKAARAIVSSAVDAVAAAEKDLIGQGLRPSQERGKCPSLDKCGATLSDAFEAETDAACVLVSERPTTMAGIMALLRYAIAADIDGEGWPTDLVSAEGDDKTRSWHFFLIEALLEALPQCA